MTCHCRVVTLCNGLRALLISDQQSEKHTQNGKHPAGAEAAELREQSAQCDNDDDDIIELDDGDSSWTDMSSDDDVSASSTHDFSASDSDYGSKKVGGKKQSRHSHSSSNIHSCSGEKLVRIFSMSHSLEHFLLKLGFEH